MQRELKHAQRWFRKAESDLANARRTTASEGPYDTACFHAQQAAEKYLEGCLVSQGQSVPRTHDLEELALQADDITPLGLSLPQLAGLSYYTVEARYDLDMWPEQEIAQRETEIGERVEAAVLVHVPGEAHP